MPDIRTIRIVIADDHAIFRDGLRRLLQEEPELRVVGEAADGAEAVTLLACLWRWKLNPAWVVLGGGLAGLALAAVR